MRDVCKRQAAPAIWHHSLVTCKMQVPLRETTRECSQPLVGTPWCTVQAAPA